VRKEDNISYYELFDNSRSLLAFLARFLSLFFCAYFEPTLSRELKAYDMNERHIGIIYSSTGLAFSLGAVLGGLLIKVLPTQVIFSIGYLIAVLACFSTGPS